MPNRETSSHGWVHASEPTYVRKKLFVSFICINQVAGVTPAKIPCNTLITHCSVSEDDIESRCPECNFPHLPTEYQIWGVSDE